MGSLALPKSALQAEDAGGSPLPGTSWKLTSFSK